MLSSSMLTLRRIPLAIALVLAFILIAPPPPANAGELANAGPGGQFFHDPDTGLYWFDAAIFEPHTRSEVELFVTYSPYWSWATSSQIDALIGQTVPSGMSLQEIMGASQTGNPGLVARWVGFYAQAEQPDGYLIQTENSPYTTLDVTGTQSNCDLQPRRGAWVVGNQDPTHLARLDDLGPSGEYFHDQETDLYWSDPASFVGMTREEVQGWIDGNEGWRWATESEVFGLVGRMAVGDVALIEVMGSAQLGNYRWIGYYDQTEPYDGLLLQTGFLANNTIIAVCGGQGGVVNWDPGAWVVSEADPTPAVGKSLSGVKELFR